MAFGPALFALIEREDRQCAHVLLPVLWVAFIHSVDMLFLFHARSNTKDRPASIRLDASSLTGLVFGVSAYLGTKCDSRYGHLFLYAIVGSIAAVLPSHNLLENSLEEQIVESVQKAVLINCIGLVLAGVALTKASIGAPLRDHGLG